MGSVGFRHDAKCKDKVLPGSKGNRGKLSWWDLIIFLARLFVDLSQILS